MRKCLILLAIALGGCNANGWPDLTKPVAMSVKPPKGPYVYRKGWSDGCKTGLTSTNTDFHLALGTHKFTLDENLRYNTLYQKAWGYAFNHCGYSMKTLKQYDF